MIKKPSFVHALVCFVTIISMISFGLFVYEISLHSIIFLCLVWVGLNTYLLGYQYLDIQGMMNQAISQALPALYIFILIGMVIASFMQSGTIASLIYYGLDWLSAGSFLLVGLLLCCLMSVLTGTSWGTVGTLGVVFMGIGAAMSIPLPLVAGMVISGATFGDKLSPVSDTTNLAAMSAETDLYAHIKSMLYTTVPTLIIVMTLMIYFGLKYESVGLPHNEISAIRDALDKSYGLNPLVTLLPLIVMLGLSMKRVSAQVSMSFSILCAVFIAIFYQQTYFADVLNALWKNQAGTTGIANIDALLGRGGISSMAWTLFLSIMALAMGGMLYKADFLESLLLGLIVRVKKVGSLVLLTISSSLLGNLAMGEAYISIILNCQLYRSSFDDQKLGRQMLSRTVEEGSTLTTSLIPWTTAGAFYASTLDVAVIEYAPYAFLNYLNPLVSVIMAYLGFGIIRSVNTTVPEESKNTG
ncbi:MAG: NhaC family Na+:H+ antiporter [Candidatus Azotimanducaceae bacterium]|jgi:NhaC family Na+:H+ antiporter